MSFASSHRLRTLLLLSLVTSTVAAQSQLGQYGEIVISSGMPIPSSNGASPNDFPAGAVVVSTGTVFTAPVLDLNGSLLTRVRVADNAGLGISGVNGSAYLLGRSNGDLRMIVRGSDPAPGCPPTTLLRTSSATANGLQAIRISPLGEWLLLGASIYDPTVPTNTPTSSDSAYFWGQPGAMVLMAREGTLVPSLSNGEVFGSIDTSSNQSWLLNSSGTALIRNQMLIGTGGVTSSNDAILLLGTPGTLTTFLREGDVWTGVGASGGEVLDRYSSNNQFPTSGWNLNESGAVLHDLHFVVGSGTIPVTAADDRAVAIYQGGTDVIVARENQQAPGLPTGVVFADVSAFVGFASFPQNSFNKSNVAFFSTSLAGTGVTTSNNQALYTASVGGGLNLVARSGDPAPASLGAGVTYVSFNNASLSMNDSGLICMFATVTGGTVTTADDSVMLLGTPGNLTVIAREGAPFTLLPGTWTFSAINQNAHLTERGSLVWNQPVTDGANTRSLWLSYTAEQGLRIFYDPTETYTTFLGPLVPSSMSTAGTIQSGDTSSVHVNNHGDFASTLNFATGFGSAVVRGHFGSLIAKPAAVPAAGLVPQDFALDCGAANASQIYILIGSLNGTRPGTPFPPITIPLNLDGWLDISIGYANTAVYTNTLGLLDANGKASMSFTLPAGVSGAAGLTLHHSAVVLDFFTLAPVLATEPTSLKFY